MNLKKINPALKQNIEEQSIEIFPLVEESFSTIKSGVDVVVISENIEVLTQLAAISIIQKLQKPGAEYPRALVIVKDIDEVFAMRDALEHLGALNQLRLYYSHEKTDLDNDKNQISLGIDVLIGTPQRISELFSGAGFDANRLLLFVIHDTLELLKKRHTNLLSRLLESIKKPQRLFTSQEIDERLENFAYKNMGEEQWFEDSEE